MQKRMDVMRSAHKAYGKVGICRQGLSDYPDFAAFLVPEGIDWISLNLDNLLELKK
jgi:pyruvate,water dikinase